MPKLSLKKAAILGATGPTGIHLAHELLARDIPVRVVSRSATGLARCFKDTTVEPLSADVLDAEATLQAIAGCDTVFDCIGLPAQRMQDHPATARNIAHAIGQTGARCVQISSYWAYLPIVKLPLNEQHPRTDGVRFVQLRREAEDILRQAGAAIVNLPDFYGPHVHTSTLQQALMEAISGNTFNWMGSSAVEREYIYIPDAMRIVVTLAGHAEAYGEHWIIPGSGPVSAKQIAAIASRHLNRPLKVRSAGLWMLRLIGLFAKPLRQFMPMVPYYMQPISYDGTKLKALIGPVEMTTYAEGIRHTLNWIQQNPKNS